MPERAPTSPATTPTAYDTYVVPTVAAALEALVRALGPDRAAQAWGQAIWDAEVTRVADVFTSSELARVAACLGAQPGAVGVLGRALQIRVHTYDRLAAAERSAPRADPARTGDALVTPPPQHGGGPPAGSAAAAETARLEEIAALGLVSGDRDPALDAMAREAAAELGAPVALINVVLDTAVHVAASHGLAGWIADVGGLPAEWAFCAHTARLGAPLVIEDTTANPLSADSPLVLVDGVRAYAGVPLISARGHALGTMCVLGTAARPFSAADVAALTAHAARTAAHLESRRTGDG